MYTKMAVLSSSFGSENWGIFSYDTNRSHAHTPCNFFRPSHGLSLMRPAQFLCDCT